MFPCEACGHPLNVHAPCNAIVGKGKKARLCGCPAFQPDDLKRRVASLTDTATQPQPGQMAAGLLEIERAR